MSDQWSDILTTYHLSSCHAPDEPCTCRMDEVIKGVAELEVALDKRLRQEYMGEDHRLGGIGTTFEEFRDEALGGE